MTTNELKELLNSDKRVTAEEIWNIVFELQINALNSQHKMLTEFDVNNKEKWISNYSFYNGEIDAFQTCLCLLSKMDRNSVFKDIKTGLNQAIEYEKGKKKC